MGKAQTLVDDCSKYVGQYVITSHLDPRTVVVSSYSAEDAYSRAVEMNVDDPIIIYIPTTEDKIYQIPINTGEVK